MRKSKSKILKIFALLLLLCGVFLIVYGFLYIKNENNKVEYDISNKNNEQTKLFYNNDIYFLIEDSNLKYVNNITKTQTGKSFPYGVLKILATKSCNDDSLFQLYVLTKNGKLYINKYPSPRISDTISFEFDFIPLTTNEKIKDMNLALSNGCESGAVTVTLSDGSNKIVSLKNSSILYNNNNYILESISIN